MARMITIAHLIIKDSLVQAYLKDLNSYNPIRALLLLMPLFETAI